MSAFISATELRQDVTGKQFTVYIVDVRRGDYNWRIERRYSTFLRFYEHIKAVLGKQYKLSKFPPKTLGLSKLSTKVVDNRISKLDTILSELAEYASSSDHNDLISDQEFIFFFQLHNMWPPVEKGDAEFVRELLEYEGVNPDTKRPGEGEPPWYVIHEAADHPHVDLLRVLLENNADTEVKTEENNTPLLLAAAKGHLEAAELLVDFNANMDWKNKEQKSALHLAISNNHVQLAIMLIDKYADLNLEDGKGEWPLSLAVLGNHIPIIQAIIAAHGDVNYKSSASGNTALHLSAENPDLDPISTLLIQSGADVSAGDSFGWTPLHRAIHSGNDTVLPILLESGADLNAQTSTGETPLMLACKEGDLDVVRILVTAGADCNVQQEDGSTPLQAACEQQEVPICDYLLQDAPVDISRVNKAQENVLHTAARLGSSIMMTLMIQHVLDHKLASILEATDSEQCTPLMYMCQSPDVSERLVCSAVTSGADVSAANVEGFTLLHVACDAGLVNVVSLLLEREGSALVNLQSTVGLTPLHIASLAGHLQIARMLLEHNASVALLTDEGDSALHYAASQNHNEICELLIAHGADIKLKGKGKKTPINLAKDANGGTKPSWAK